MGGRKLRAIVGASLLLAVLSGAAVAGPGEASGYLTKYSAAAFARLPELRQPLEAQVINLDLLSAAVFYETNRRRAQHGLKPLADHSRARKAATERAVAMARRNQLVHGDWQPGASGTGPGAGAGPGFRAENISLATAYRVPDSKRVYVRDVAGRKIMSRVPDGPAIPASTYAGFARELLDRWMESPLHRANILDPGADYLGCSCRPESKATTFRKFYCAQLFFARSRP